MGKFACNSYQSGNAFLGALSVGCIESTLPMRQKRHIGDNGRTNEIFASLALILCCLLALSQLNSANMRRIQVGCDSVRRCRVNPSAAVG